MEPLIVLAVTFVLLWVLFILPQQRRVRAHQQLVAALEPGDEVVLTAGIYGRIIEVGPEDMTVEVAPGVELRVARQAVLRRVEDATACPPSPTSSSPPPPTTSIARDSILLPVRSPPRRRRRARGAPTRRPGPDRPWVARSELMRRKIYLPLILILVVAYGGLIATLVAGNSPELGLDLQGGVSVVLAPTGDASDEQLDQALDDHPRPGRRPRRGRARHHPPGRRHRRPAAGREEPRPRPRAGGPDRRAAVPAGAAAGPVPRGPGRRGAAGGRRPGGLDDVDHDPGRHDPDHRAAGAASTTTAPGATTTTTAPTSDEGAWGAEPGPPPWSKARAPRPAQEPTTTTTAPPATTTTAPATDPTATTVPEPEAQVPALTPRDQDVADAAGHCWRGADGTTIYQLGPALATGRIVETASADIQNGTVVGPARDAGRRGRHRHVQRDRRHRATPRTPTRRCARRVSSPSCSTRSCSRRPPSTSRATRPTTSRSSGAFSESEAKDLALVLRYGSLPVELERQTRADRVGHAGRRLAAGRHHRRHRRPGPRRPLHARSTTGRSGSS